MKRFLRWLLPLLLPLALAVPSFAAVTTAHPSQRLWTVSFVNGDTADSAAIPNTCAAWRASLDPATGGVTQATIFGIADQSFATTSGTSLTNGLLTFAGTTMASAALLSTALPYIKVDVVTGPTSGTAVVYLYCTIDSAAGGGSTPGAVGSDTPLVFAATADTNDSATAPSLTNATGFSVSLPASATYSMLCYMISTADVAGDGEVYGFTTSAALSTFTVTYRTIEGAASQLIQVVTTSGTSNNINSAANSSGTSAVVGTAFGRIVTSGATTLQVVLDSEAVTSTGTNLLAGSRCELRRTA